MAQAECELRAGLVYRTTPSTESITAESLVRDVVQLWFDERLTGPRALVDNSRRRYRSIIEERIGPSVGPLRVREANVTRMDRFLKNLAADTSSATALLCRTILSGAMSMAVRHGAGGDESDPRCRANRDGVEQGCSLHDF